jgi:hypothetical protein
VHLTKHLTQTDVHVFKRVCLRRKFFSLDAHSIIPVSHCQPGLGWETNAEMERAGGSHRCDGYGTRDHPLLLSQRRGCASMAKHNSGTHGPLFNAC